MTAVNMPGQVLLPPFCKYHFHHDLQVMTRIRRELQRVGIMVIPRNRGNYCLPVPVLGSDRIDKHVWHNDVSITGPWHFWNYQWTSMDRVWYVGLLRSFKLARLTYQTCLRELPLLWPRCARYLSDFCQYSRFDLSWTSCSDPMYISNP